MEKRPVPPAQPDLEDRFSFTAAKLERGRKLTHLADGVMIRFKTVEDHVACRLERLTETADLAIDASGCQHESRLLFRLSSLSSHMVRMHREAVLRIAYSLTARMPAAGESPIRQIALFEYAPDGELRAAHKLRKNAPLAEGFETRTFQTDFQRPEQPVGFYELGVILAPHAAPFIVRGASARATSVVTAACELAQNGTRLQGLTPADAKNVTIRLQCGDREVDVPVAMPNFTLVRTEAATQFDTSLLKLNERLAAGRDAVSGQALLLIDGALAAFCQVDILALQPTKPEKFVEQPALAGDDHQVRQAEAEIRRGRNLAGLALLDQTAERSVALDRTAARLRMRALINLRRFDEAIALFESLDARLRNEAAMRSRYVEACANVRDFDRATAELRKIMFLDRTTAVANIAALYRFSPLLPPQQRAMMTDLMASAAPEARAQATVIMRCAHDYIQANDWKGYFDLVRVLDGFDLSPAERGRMALLRAQMAFRLNDVPAMVEQLNAALTALKASPIRLLQPERGLTLDNVAGCETETRSDGPMVSVMMTSFNSAETIRYAIESILGQTHANLELLVADDASTDDSPRIIADYAARDPRVVPILSAANAGTYVSKNLALSRARGEFVTCQDSDDWAHPAKLRASVARLMANPRLVATGVQHVRLSPQAGLQFRADYVRPDASSLMYRTQPVRRSIGFYDSVRAGADSEFQRRLELGFGRAAVQYGQELLSLVLWSPGSLSGGGDFAIDDDSGFLTPARNAYRQSFVQWHEQSDSHHIDFPLTERPFEAPASMLPQRG